jgi:hypothetical protein
VSRLVSFIKKKHLIKIGLVEDLDPYEEWLSVFYEEGLDQRKLSTARIQKMM